MSKKTEKAPKKAKRVKQGELPGVERKHIKEVEDAALAYVEARDARMKLTEGETEAQGALIDTMKKHKLATYRYEEAVPPLTVMLTPGKDRVKVVRTSADGGEG